MTTARGGLRMSAALRERMATAGELSAVARALCVLGLAAAGEDVAPYTDEARRSLAGISDPRIAQALGRLLFNTGSTPVEPVLNTPAELLEMPTRRSETPLAELLEDPFAVGVEV